MAGRVPPHDLEAEESLLGAMMLSREAVREASDRVVSRDFYKPAHATIYEAIVGLWETGQNADPVTVSAELKRLGQLEPVGGRQALLRIQAGTPASGNAPEYIEIMLRHATRRSLIEKAASIAERAYAGDIDLMDLIDSAQADMADVLRPGAPRRFPHYAEWRLGIDMKEKWVIPNILERRDRIIIVAPEGFGKSFLIRQWALMAACGVHWFTERRIPPVPTLVIDVENSDRQVRRNTDRMYTTAERQAPGFNPENYTIIPFATLDITSRVGRTEVESYIAGHRPAILSIGPLYKVIPPSSRTMSYEENAARAISVLDDWRARYDIAVLIEHHAPKGSQGRRELDPFGSSLWLRWPEFGLKLEPTDDNPMIAHLGHFRGQREWRRWPATLERASAGSWQWRSPLEERSGPGIGDEPF